MEGLILNIRSLILTTLPKFWQCKHQPNLLQQVQLLKTAKRNKLNIN